MRIVLGHIGGEGLFKQETSQRCKFLVSSIFLFEWKKSRWEVW